MATLCENPLRPWYGIISMPANETRFRPLAALLTAVVLAGCQNIGPGSVERDRIDYAGALGNSWKEQTLLNIVKLRYLDTPVFLDVTSVVSMYEMAGQANSPRRSFLARRSTATTASG